MDDFVDTLPPMPRAASAADELTAYDGLGAGRGILAALYIAAFAVEAAAVIVIAWRGWSVSPAAFAWPGHFPTRGSSRWAAAGTDSTMNAPDRAAWLAERRSGIGGSDIAALLTDPKVQQQMALAWRGLAEVHRAEDGVTVVFKEGR